MELNAIKESVVVKVYHINSDTKVPLHKHDKQDEIFYCMKGSGFGVLEDGQVELSGGKAFIVPAGTMHSLNTEGNLYVSSFLVPLLEDRKG